MPHRIILINDQLEESNPPNVIAIDITETNLDENQWGEFHKNCDIILLVLLKSFANEDFQNRLCRTVEILDRIAKSVRVTKPSPFLERQCDNKPDFLSCAVAQINMDMAGGYNQDAVATLTYGSLPYRCFLLANGLNNLQGD